MAVEILYGNHAEVAATLPNWSEFGERGTAEEM